MRLCFVPVGSILTNVDVIHQSITIQEAFHWEAEQPAVSTFKLPAKNLEQNKRI